MYSEYHAVNYQQPQPYYQPLPVYYVPKRRYGFWNFVLDITLICLTWGVWIIWIFIRELRNLR